MRRLSLLLALALVLPASAQTPDALALYIGPAPNPDGTLPPVPKDFADSHADLKKAYAKARSAGNAGIMLVDDPAQADAILTVTHRGDVDNGGAVGTALPISSPGVSISSTRHLTPTLQARLTVRATNEGTGISGVGADWSDRTRWSVQAERIYEQAAAMLIASHDRLIELRQR